MKNHRASLAISVIVTMLAGAVFYALTNVSASTAKRSAASQEAAVVYPTTGNPSLASNSDFNKSVYVTKQQVNGIEIEIVNKQLMGNFLLVDVCYQLPSDADWLLSTHPEDITLTIGDTTILHSGWKDLDETTKSNGNKMRCDRISFQVNRQDDLSRFVVTINHLVTSAPESPDCDKAQAKLDKRNTGIKIKCSKTESSFSYEVTKKPGNISDYELRQSIENAFSDTVDGPWILTDTLSN